LCKLESVIEKKRRSEVSRKLNLEKGKDIKPWIIAAVDGEDRKAADPLWKDAPSAQDACEERLRRVKFLRKDWTTDLKAKDVADRQEACEATGRCLSGACPECGRLLQRWFVRQLKTFIASNISKVDEHPVALNIVPATAIVRLGKLASFSSANLQRRLKHALAKAGIGPALGGIDFSFNEDDNEQYQPFWSPHIYLITSEISSTQTSILRTIFERRKEIPKPILITPFTNKAHRRSYALKMMFTRRIGYEDTKVGKDGTYRKCRNTCDDRLRADERLELYMYLDQIGLAERVIFWQAKPVVTSNGVAIL
jgi:hypothetical protein